MLEVFLRNAGVHRHLLRGGLEKAAVIDVADDYFRGLAVVRAERGLIELPHQVLLQRFLGGDGIEEKLALLLVLLGAAAIAARLRHVIAPLVIQLRELIELLFEIVVRAGLRVLGCGLGAGLIRQLLEHGIGFHLLLDEIAQFQKRRLEDEQALLQLRRENLLEREVLRLVHPRTGHGGRLSGDGGKKQAIFAPRRHDFHSPGDHRTHLRFRRNANCSHHYQTGLA